MSVISIVSYEASPDLKFDMKYYLATHMPLVLTKWSKFGLKSWSVVTGDEGSLYAVQALLFWKSEEQCAKAFSDATKDEVFGDIPNFSNKQPVRMGGKVVGQSG